MPITPEAFRDALRHFPAGVTIVTIKSGEQAHGLTVSAFASGSPEPPELPTFIPITAFPWRRGQPPRGGGSMMNPTLAIPARCTA